MEFILLDESVPRSERGEDGGGALGRLGPSNPDLGAYAAYPKGAPTLDDLAIGQEIQGVEYRLSGGRGRYTVRRVA